jgi:DNA end-binding protein Ku
MARAIWTGSVAFGLVNVPVAMYAATEDKTIHYNQFQAGTSDRIRYKRVNERTGREVKPEDIVRGHEVAKGDYVLVTDEELEAVEPGRSRTIEITDFVELAEIDPIYFQRTYYLGPQGDGAAARAYALLHRAMADTGKAGIATFVFHGKQYLVTLRASSDVLALQTMYFADEVRDPREVIDNLPAAEKLVPRELTIAKQLVDSMSTKWNPDEYRDSYRERVEDLIARKQRGEEVVTEGPPTEGAEVTDLMDALRRSAEEIRGRRQRPSSAKRTGSKAERKSGATGQASGDSGKGTSSRGRRRRAS